MRGHETHLHALLGVRVVRIWRAEIDPSHAGEYDDFARTKSLRMFRAQPGFRAVLFNSYGVERLVVTFWQDWESVEALQRSPTYAATVNEIEESGFLRGEQTVKAFDIDSVFSGDQVDDAAHTASREDGHTSGPAREDWLADSSRARRPRARRAWREGRRGTP